MARSRDPGYWMAGSCVARRAGGGDGGGVLVVSRFDRGPRRVGHARIVHIDVGTDIAIDTDADLGAGFDANSDSDRDAAPAPTLTVLVQSAVSGPFRSPSGNVNCTMFTSAGQNIARCEVIDHAWAAPPRSTDCHLNWGDRFELTEGSVAAFNCYGQEFPTPEHTLAYGQTRSLGTITCDSEYTGMTCTDSSTGHYFRVARETYQLG
jgi:hypothetical protein